MSDSQCAAWHQASSSSASIDHATDTPFHLQDGTADILGPNPISTSCGRLFGLEKATGLSMGEPLCGGTAWGTESQRVECPEPCCYRR